MFKLMKTDHFGHPAPLSANDHCGSTNRLSVARPLLITWPMTWPEPLAVGEGRQHVGLLAGQVEPIHHRVLFDLERERVNVDTCAFSLRDALIWASS